MTEFYIAAAQGIVIKKILIRLFNFIYRSEEGSVRLVNLQNINSSYLFLRNTSPN